MTLRGKRETAITRLVAGMAEPPPETCDCESWQFCEVCGTREDFRLWEAERG